MWYSRRVENNGLRPRWNESLVVLSSHPELAVIHIEVKHETRTPIAVIYIEVQRERLEPPSR